jgi:glycosyltransferase involved in cell wall biosynthesis
MTIAIHISAGKNESLWENINFKCFTRLAAERPGDHFIFIFDKPQHPELSLESNCTPVVCAPQIRNSLLRHYWYNYKIPALLERYNAGVFITADAVCSLRTDVPQAMLTEALSLRRANTGRYWKKFLPAFLEKAKAVFVTNNIVAEELEKRFAPKKDKIKLLHPGMEDLFRQRDHQERETIKEKHTEGKDYFLFAAGAHEKDHVIVLLKAFSIFKKWQKSNMQLVLLSKAGPSPALAKDISTYKYRNEIKFLASRHEEEAAEILSAAYALIDLNEPVFFPQTGLHAMRCGVPVITDENKVTLKTYGDAALYAVQDEKNLSAKMMMLYKDEHLRNLHIYKGYQVAFPYSWEHTTREIGIVLDAITKQ